MLSFMRTNEPRGSREGVAPDEASGPRSRLEERVVDAVRQSRDELVALAAELIACDTTVRSESDPAREEERLQRILERRLRAAGAQTELWQPEPIGADNPLGIPPGLDFDGRPQLVGAIAGAGRGPSLLLNGHIDAVETGDRAAWRCDPFRAEVHGDRLYGRGSADMKGGLASLVAAIEALQRQGVRLAGDLVFCSNTDEESSGAGGWAAVDHGVAAAAGVCAEPTGLDLWIACRGVATGIMRVPGRAGHAELPQSDWRQGGAVNAIEKAAPLIASFERLREAWRTRADHQHALLSPGGIQPTMVAGGSWSATYPAWCDVACDIEYLPAAVSGGDLGAVQREVAAWVDEVARHDPWLATHRPYWTWIGNCPPAEVAADHGIVTAVAAAARSVGRSGRCAGLDSWHDAATFTVLGGTPTIAFGPGELAIAHAVDEHVPIDDLVDHAAAAALAAMHWCGVAAGPPSRGRRPRVEIPVPEP